MESVSPQAPASLTPHKSRDWLGQTVAKRKNEDGGNVKKKVRFDVPVTSPLSCPSSSMSPIEAIPGTSRDPFPNAVFSFDPPVQPLQSQVSAELDIEPKNMIGYSSLLIFWAIFFIEMRKNNEIFMKITFLLL